MIICPHAVHKTKPFMPETNRKISPQQLQTMANAIRFRLTDTATTSSIVIPHTAIYVFI